jgi:hypothetical protein
MMPAGHDTGGFEGDVPASEMPVGSQSQIRVGARKLAGELGADSSGYEA